MLRLFLQIALAVPDSGYATPALRDFVARAAEVNRLAPASLAGYEATAESEVAVFSRRDDGTELVVAVEQLGSRLTWRRDGAFEQRVVGHRARFATISISTLAVVDEGWVVPTLYGNRMALLFGRDSVNAGDERDGTRRRDAKRDPVLAVHPFAADRDRVYRFSGGDTVATVRANGRVIPIARVRVEPRADLPARTFVFRGEVDVDAARHHIVRMRGQFLVTGGGPPSLRERLQRGAFTSLAYAQLENQEVEGRYWLPAYQRLELQGGASFVGDLLGVVRIVTRVRDFELHEVPAALAAVADSMPPDSAVVDSLARVLVARGDSLVPAVHRLTVAPPDSVAAYDDWSSGLGEETSGLATDDFDDVVPPALREDAQAGVEVYAPRLSDFARFNRVEGLYTGAGLRWRAGPDAPGVTVQGAAGWAWAEGTARGRVEGTLARERWSASLGAGRTLDPTNDFLGPADSGATINALVGQDDFDYVDRRWAEVGGARRVGARSRLWLSVGPASDRAVVAHVERGLVGEAQFRPVRGIRAGDYLRTRLELALDPSVRVEFVRPGTGGHLRWERGDGDLRYDRVELRLETRREWTPVTLVARGDVGVVSGAPLPPQQLFELGGARSLSGYAYKAFAGDRAARATVLGMYDLPLWRAPIRIPIPFWRTIYLPGPSPALAAGASLGWVDQSNAEARAAALLLGHRRDEESGALHPISRPTDGARGSVEVGLRFFGGSVFVGVARAVERGERVRWVVGF